MKGYGFQFYAGPTAENPEQREIFFHRADAPADFDFALLPSRDLVFEFTVTEDKSGKPAAREVQLVTSYNGNGKKNGHRER